MQPGNPIFMARKSNKPGEWLALMLFVRRLFRATWQGETRNTRELIKWMTNEKAKRAWNRKRKKKHA